MTHMSWGKAALTSLIAPSVTLVLAGYAFYHFNAFDAYADVQVNLSGIGQPTEADLRIAPGRAPVELRAPESVQTRGTAQQIRLTPPPSLRGEITPQSEAPRETYRAEPEPRPAPAVLATPPASPQPATPQSAPPQSATSQPATHKSAPVELAPVESAPVEPALVEPTPAPRQQEAALNAPASLTPVPQPAAPSAAIEAEQAAPVAAPAGTPATVPDVATPAPTPAPSSAPTQLASLPAPVDAAHRLRFEAGDADLLPATREELEMIALELMRHSDRIEVQAYAGDTGDISSANRRLSLKRGLAVRKFLVEKGVLQNRIDVRALGGPKDSGPTERVDILLSRRQR